MTNGKWRHQQWRNPQWLSAEMIMKSVVMWQKYQSVMCPANNENIEIMA
jgi:hypothetical protein